MACLIISTTARLAALDVLGPAQARLQTSFHLHQVVLHLVRLGPFGVGDVLTQRAQRGLVGVYRDR